MKTKTVLLESGQLSLSGDKWTDICRVGNWENSYKQFKLTRNMLSEMIANFKNNILRYADGKIPFNFSHTRWEKASGWITDLRLNGRKLQALVNWTDEAIEKISDGTYKYVSAEIAFSYRDEETEKTYENVLLGSALTNVPFVRGMKPVSLSEDGTETVIPYLFNNNFQMDALKNLLEKYETMDSTTLAQVEAVKELCSTLTKEDQEEFTDRITKLGDKAKQIEAEESKTEKGKAKALAEAKQNLEEAKKANKELSTKIETLSEEKQKTFIASEIENLASSGKIIPAQKEAFTKFCETLSTEQIKEFIDIYKKQKAVVDFSILGKTGTKTETTEDLSDGKIAEINEKAKELSVKENISMFDAVSRLTKEAMTA